MVMYTLLPDLNDRPLGRDDVLATIANVQTQCRLAEMRRIIHPSVMEYIAMGHPGSMVLRTWRCKL